MKCSRSCALPKDRRRHETRLAVVGAGDSGRRGAGGGLALLCLTSAVVGVTCEPTGHPIEVGRSECVSCHLSDYEAADNPMHLDRFSLECAGCHDEDHWRPARFDHEWPLDGVHATLMCASCHPGDPPDYDGTPRDCVGCHADDRARATEPDHAAFSMDCGECHTAAGWQPAAFDHDWPLDGAHAMLRCASCHEGEPPQYAGTPTECVDCHRADYDASPYPGHADFPLACDGCHTTNAWTPATAGAHPEMVFPITAGPHHELDCMECHNAELGPNGKDNADCVGCHTGKHTRALLDPKHHEVSDYPSGEAPPNFCLDCHGDGRN